MEQSLDEWAVDQADAEELARIAASFERATEYLFHWTAAAHHRIWANAIEALFRRDIRRLLIVAPPAHAKTNWAGVAAPTYYLGHNPYHHILYMSSAQGQALKSSVAVRDSISINRRFRALFPHTRPDTVKGWAAKRWFIDRPEAPGDKDPSFLAAGVGSQEVLGARADLLEFDDINTQENTATAYRRDKVKDWVRQTAFSREAKDAIHLAIMTRWHTDDIAQFFENEGGYEVIVMPALGYWEDPDAYLATPQRAPNIEGEPLWPELYDREFLQSKQVELGPAKFAGMYQGRPVPEGGQLFKESFWQPYYVPFSNPHAKEVLTRHGRALEPPYNAVVVGDTSVALVHTAAFIDTAFKDTDEADYTVFSLWGVGVDRQAYLLDIWRRQRDANLLFGDFISWWRTHRPDIAVIEDRASGIQLIQDIQQKTSIPFDKVVPFVNKEERAKVQTHVIEGAFHLPDPDMMEPEESKLYTDFIAEHANFPADRNDDMVDTTVMAAERLRPHIDWFNVEEADQKLELLDLEDMVRAPTLPARESSGPMVVSGGEDLGAGYGGSFGNGRSDWPER